MSVEKLPTSTPEKSKKESLVDKIDEHKATIDDINSDVQKSKGIKESTEELDAKVAKEEGGIYEAEDKIFTEKLSKETTEYVDSLNSEIATHRAAIDDINSDVQKSKGLKKSMEELGAEVSRHEDAIREAERKIGLTHTGESQSASKEQLDKMTKAIEKEDFVGNTSKESTGELIPIENPETAAVLKGLEGRSDELDKEAAKIGFSKESFMKLGEWWGKQNKWVRIGTGVGLVAASALAGGPIGSVLISSAMAGRGILVGASTMYTTGKFLRNSREKKERWWNKYPDGTSAILGIVAGLGASHLLSGFDGSEEAINIANADVKDAGVNLVDAESEGTEFTQETIQTSVGSATGETPEPAMSELVPEPTPEPANAEFAQEVASKTLPVAEAVEISQEQVTAVMNATVDREFEKVGIFGTDFGARTGLESELWNNFRSETVGDILDVHPIDMEAPEGNSHSLVGSEEDLDTLQTYLKTVEGNIGPANPGETVEQYIRRGIEHTLQEQSG